MFNKTFHLLVCFVPVAVEQFEVFGIYAWSSGHLQQSDSSMRHSQNLSISIPQLLKHTCKNISDSLTNFYYVHHVRKAKYFTFTLKRREK